VIRAALVLATVCALLVAAPAGAPAAASAHRAPAVDARSFLLVDGDSGAVLASDGADEPLPIASITKLMTVRVALQRLRPSQVVRVSKAAAAVGESTIDLRPGQAISVHDLLAGALIQSANDAADALADAAAGGKRPAFIAAMNAEAAKLGLHDTHFARPDGLDAPGHVSSAADVTRLARLEMRDPRVRAIVRERSAVIAGGRRLSTWNDLLSSFPGVFGVKTGHTGDAGWCEVVAARWQGVTLYATILGSPTRERRDADLAALLRYGFTFFGHAQLVQPGHVYARAVTGFGRAPIDLVAAHGANRVVRADRPLTQVVVAPASVSLPVQKGQQLGRIEVRSGRRVLTRIPLVAARSEARPSRVGRIEWYTARALSHLSPF
jgi:serine-type D-Ala-D-Ala carboxypeptidase (penicillin-binding protein 5/6)